MKDKTKQENQEQVLLLRAVPLLGAEDTGALFAQLKRSEQGEEELKNHLSGEQLRSYVSLYDFGGLKSLSVEDLQQEIGARNWKKFCSMVLCDVKSYFTLEQESASQSSAATTTATTTAAKDARMLLVCHMPEYMVQVRFAVAKPGKKAKVSCTCEGRTLGSTRSKANDKDKLEDQDLALSAEPLEQGTEQKPDTKAKNLARAEKFIAQVAEFAGKDYTSSQGELLAEDDQESVVCEHQYLAKLLYLLLTEQLQCDDVLYQLFYKRERYAEYFSQVLSVLATIGAQGFNNLNYDVQEMVKATYVRANSFGIAFLKNDLSNLYLKLKQKLEQRFSHSDKSVSVTKVLALCARIYNILEAIEQSKERSTLVKLYGFNEEREYAISALTLIGCGYQHFSKSDTELSKIFYFYCPERHEFMAIRALVSSFFSTPTLLMETECSLYDAVQRVYKVENAMISSGKLKNSKFSLPFEYNLPFYQRLQLYKSIALPDFAALRAKAYAEAPRYFDPAQYTGGLYLVKVQKVVDIIDKSPEPLLKVVFEDAALQHLVVRVTFKSNYFLQLKKLKKIKDQYQKAKDFIAEQREFLEQHQDQLEEEKRKVLKRVLSELDAARDEQVAVDSSAHNTLSSSDTDDAAAAAVDADALSSTTTTTTSSSSSTSAATASNTLSTTSSSNADNEDAKAQTAQRKVNKLITQAQEHLQVLEHYSEEKLDIVDYILVDCPLISGRIRPILASLFKITSPDRQADQKHHKMVKSRSLTIKNYKGAKEHGSLCDLVGSAGKKKYRP